MARSMNGLTVAGGQPRSDMFYIVTETEDNSTLKDPAITNYKGIDFLPYEYQGILITGIDDFAFVDSKITSLIVEFSDHELTLGSNLFNGSKIQSVVINRRISYENTENIFAGAPHLQTVVLPDDIPGFELGMFANCRSLKNILFEAPKQEDDKEKMLSFIDNAKNNLLNKLKIDEELKENHLEIYNEYYDRVNLDSIVFIPQTEGFYINSLALANTGIEKLHIYDNVKTVGASAMAYWDNDVQTIFIHNKNASANWDMGWDSNWTSKEFKNITYDVKYYTFTLNPNGGVLNGSFEKIKIVYTDTESFELPEPEREGYSFIEWQYSVGEKSYSFNYSNWTADKKNMELTAQWHELITVTLQSDVSDHNYCELSVLKNQNTRPINVAFVDQKDQLPESTETQIYIHKRVGYEFIGFSKEKGYSDGNTYYLLYSQESNQIICTDAWKSTNDVELYECWKIITYYMYFDGIFDNSIVKPKELKFTVNSDIDIKPIIYSNEKLIWEYSNTLEVDLSKVIGNKITNNGRRVELKAQIFYILNGGTNNDKNISYISFDKEFVLYEPVKAGYNFRGWSYDGKDVNSIIYDTDKVTNSEEDIIIVSAIWIPRAGTFVVRMKDTTSRFNIDSDMTIELPRTMRSTCEFIIGPNAHNVQIYGESYRQYNIYITINSKPNAEFNLYLDNLIIKAPQIEVNGKMEAQSAIYMHTENTIPIWEGTKIPSSIPRNPFITGFNPPVVVGPTLTPIIHPTSYSTTRNQTSGSKLNLYTFGKVEIYGASGRNGTVSDKNGGHGACAIFCENFALKHADDLYLIGGSAGKAYGDGIDGYAAYGVLAVYSIDSWQDDYGPLLGINKVVMSGGYNAEGNACAAPLGLVF